MINENCDTVRIMSKYIEQVLNLWFQNSNPKVLILSEKYENPTYLVNNREAMLLAAKEIVRKRDEELNLYISEIPEPVPPFPYTAEEIKNLRGAAQDAAKAERRRLAALHKNREQEAEEFVLRKCAIVDGNSEAALQLLLNHQDYEYEGFTLQDLKIPTG